MVFTKIVLSKVPSEKESGSEALGEGREEGKEGERFGL